MARTGSMLLAGLGAWLVLLGCGEKVSKEQLEQLGALAGAAKERAVSFGALAPSMDAKDPAAADAMRRYVTSHAESLARKAKAMADLYEVAQGKKPGKAALAQLADDIATSTAETKGWEQAYPLLKVSDEFALTHLAGLKRDAIQTEGLLKILTEIMKRQEDKKDGP